MQEQSAVSVYHVDERRVILIQFNGIIGIAEARLRRVQSCDSVHGPTVVPLFQLLRGESANVCAETVPYQIQRAPIARVWPLIVDRCVRQ